MMNKNRKKSLPTKVVFYSDPLTDEFSTAEISPRRIDGKYRYDREIGVRHVFSGFWYRLVAVPLALCYLKHKLHHTVVGKEKLKTAEKQGFFIYGNHTQIIGDALIPSAIRLPKKPSVIVHPNNVSMPFLGRCVPYLGGIPLPDDLSATRSFTHLIEKRLGQGRAIFIYPEAHIWPYYTGIRPFTDDSFYYPIKYNTPVFCFTNVYKARKRSTHPKVVTYVDGPFYADRSLSRIAQRKDLRDRVYETMCSRAQLSDCTYIEYRPIEEKEGIKT